MRTQHILDIASLSDARIHDLLRNAVHYDQEGAVPPIRSPEHWLATVFSEPSTRTRCAFTVAARAAGFAVLDLDMATSAAQKGEVLEDTQRTLAAMGVAVMVVRHDDHDAVAALTRQEEMMIINAGTGRCAHPTQALGDAVVLQSHFGEDLSGRRVVVVGDIAHSRVARSLGTLLPRLGVVMHWVPDYLGAHENMAASLSVSGTVHQRLSEIVADVDAVVMLRIQKERMAEVPDTEDYLQNRGLHAGILSQLRPEAVIMHPGPCNRGIDMAPEVLVDPRCVMAHQVRAGVALRRAVLESVRF